MGLHVFVALIELVNVGDADLKSQTPFSVAHIAPRAELDHLQLLRELQLRHVELRRLRRQPRFPDGFKA